MGITQAQAIRKIVLISESDPRKADRIVDMTEKISVDSNEFDKHYKTNITMAAKDVVENCLKRSAFKKWLMHDWPLLLLNKVKPPKKIQLPVALRRIIKPEDKETIQRYWAQNFSDYKSDNWVKEYKPIFEP